MIGRRGLNEILTSNGGFFAFSFQALHDAPPTTFSAIRSPHPIQVIMPGKPFPLIEARQD